MRIPLLLADFIHARACRPKCEKFLTLPILDSGNILERSQDMLAVQQKSGDTADSFPTSSAISAT